MQGKTDSGRPEETTADEIAASVARFKAGIYVPKQQADVTLEDTLLGMGGEESFPVGGATGAERVAEVSRNIMEKPAHYTVGGIETIDALRAALTEEEFRGFCKGNILKYVWRERHKGGDVDLAKAGDYIHFALGIK